MLRETPLHALKTSLSYCWLHLIAFFNYDYMVVASFPGVDVKKLFDILTNVQTYSTNDFR